MGDENTAEQSKHAQKLTDFWACLDCSAENIMNHYTHLDRAADPHYSQLASFKCVRRTVKHPAKTNQEANKIMKKKPRNLTSS